MPRKGQHKYQQYSPDSLQSAVDAVRAKAMSVRAASKAYGVPRATISDRITLRVPDGAKNGRPPLIPMQIENNMVEKMLGAADKGFGLTRSQVMKKAQQVCTTMNIRNQYSRKNPSGTKVGKDWFEGLKTRHPELALRKPEALSTSRSRLMNQTITNRYFEDLSSTINNLNLIARPTQIWNMDETSLSFEHSPVKVVARKGSKNLPGRVADSKQTQTVLACVNAAGKCMPPLVVVKGKTPKSLYGYKTHDGPAGTIWSYQSKGYMEDLLGSQWFKEVFLKHCGPERPQLLLLDSHSSHEVVDLLVAAREENIHIMALPPHCTHYLQPLDRTVFGSLNSHYDKICSEFLQSDANNTINKATWPAIFRSAWHAALTTDNIKKGFEACGVFPVNADIIPRSAFAPSLAFKDPTAVGTVPSSTASESESVSEDPAPTAVGDSLETSERVTADAPRNDDQTVELTLAEDIQENVTDENLEAAQVLVNLSFSGSDLFEVSESEVPLLQEIQFDNIQTVTPTEYANSLESAMSITQPSNYVSWNADLESIFEVPLLSPTAPEKKKRKTISSHRLLTSEEIITEKLKAADLKLKKELDKNERKRIKEEKKEKKSQTQNKKQRNGPRN